MASSSMAGPAAGAVVAPSRPVWPGLLLATLGAIEFSGKAIIVKLAYRHGVDAVTLITYRMLFALPLFLLLAWWAGRGKPALTQRDWIVVVGLGFTGYYLASFLDFAGLAYISASFERLILYLNAPLVLVMMAIERIGATLAAQTGMIGPLSTILMGVVILGEPFTAWIAAGTVLVLAGIWLLAKWR